MSLLKQTANTKKSYKTIKFDFNGGTCSESERVVQVGLPLGILPTITKQYKDFDAWYDALDGGNKISATYVVSVNKTIYAHFKDIVRTLTYNINGHGTQPAGKQIIYGDTFGTLPELTDSYYNFTGWYLNGTKITSSSIVTTTTNITLTASWEAKKYTITLSGDSSYHYEGMSYGASKAFSLPYGSSLDTVLDTPLVVNNPPATGSYQVWGWSIVKPIIDSTTGNINNIPDSSREAGVIIYKGSTVTGNLTLYPIIERLGKLSFKGSTSMVSKIKVTARQYRPRGTDNYLQTDYVVNSPGTAEFWVTNAVQLHVYRVSSSTQVTLMYEYKDASGSSKSVYLNPIDVNNGFIIPIPYDITFTTNGILYIYYGQVYRIGYIFDINFNNSNTTGWIKDSYQKCLPYNA